MQESDPLLQPCGVYQLGCELARVHQVEEVAEDIWLYVSGLQAHAVTVLMNEEHSEVVGEGGEDSLVGFEEDISDSHGAVAQEAKLPLSVKLLQQDKTMVGQLHSSTCSSAGGSLCRRVVLFVTRDDDDDSPLVRPSVLSLGLACTVSPLC